MVLMALIFVVLTCLRNWAMVWDNDYDNAIGLRNGNDLSEELGYGMG